ncbi:MAG: hypothetical protein KIT69_02200 [Propionibacteriaceae bacterium]|nr:hypothetical protein [Propionibacteriaceae bacterium]
MTVNLARSLAPTPTLVEQSTMEIALPPAHPLVVHLAVVLLPLVALGAIVIVVSARARQRYGSLVAVGSVVAAAATIGARLSGEALAGATTATGTLGAHMFWGLIAPWPATALAAAVIGFLLAGRRSGASEAADQTARRPLQTALGVVTVVVALASLVVVVITGHLGATAVWVG